MNQPMNDAQLNRLLDAYDVPGPSPALRDRVLAAAPRRSRRPEFDLFWWASGAGLAAAGVAGLVLGSSLTAPDRAVETLLVEAEAYDVSALVVSESEALL